MNFDTFMHELSCLKDYRKSLKEIEEKMEDIIYQYCGVRGIRYDREPSLRNVYLEEDTKLRLAEALEEPQKEYDFTLMAINRIGSKLAKLPTPTREMCEMLFVDGMSYEEVGQIYYCDKSTVWKMIRREVEKI